jgi:branched-chain amino acid aminotransferase
MPTLIRRLTATGLHAVEYTADSLADAIQHEPEDGVYTVTNTHAVTKVLKFEAHLDRLEDSAQREDIPLRLNRGALRAALRSMILEASWGDSRFRVTVPKANPDQLTLTIEPFAPPKPEVYAQGVHCVTLPDSARANAAAKTTGWMHNRQAWPLPEGIYEGLLLDHEGYVLEGTSSNFYAVIGGELRTAGAGVLPGIAQQIVFEIAPYIIPLRREAIHKDAIAQVSEAFITSSSRGILPVVDIDGLTLGNGEPGPVTLALRERYAAWMKANLEEL